jgi:very-short-patch-repair endonuclease
MVHAPPQIRSHAREMRKEPTRAEDRLWSWLRDRRFGNYKFRRQHPVGDYILDFYCAELKIAIELDGVVHEVDCVAEHDKRRTRYLERQGIMIVRLENEQMRIEPDIVSDTIQWAINKRK